jgi:O-antigen/teichoic acid export membrane protein
MKANNKLLSRNFSYALVGNIIFQLCQWLLLSSLTKLSTPEVVGQYSLALAITTPLMILFNLQLRTILATDTKNQFELAQYVDLRRLTNICFLLVLFIVLIILDYSLYTVLLTIIIGLSKIVESMSDIIYGLSQKNEDMKRIATSQIYRAVLSLISFVLLFYLTKNLLISVTGILISWGGVLLFYDSKLLQQYHLSIFSFKKIKYNKNLLITSIPLGIVLMLSSLNTNIPRIFIEKYLGNDQLGYYASISYIIVAGNIIITSLGQSMAPRLSKLANSNNLLAFNETLRKLVLFSFSLGLVCFIIVFFLGKNILSIIYTPEYAKHSNLLTWFTVVCTIDFTSTFFGYALTALKKFKIQPKIALVWTVTSVILSYFLIPQLGLFGSVLSLIISSLIRLILQVVVYLLSIKQLSKGEIKYEKNTSYFVSK